MSARNVGLIIAGKPSDINGLAPANDTITQKLNVAGTTYSNAMDLGGFRNVRLQLILVGHGDTPAGKFNLYGSESQLVGQDLKSGVYGTPNERAHWTLMTLPAGSVHGVSGSAFAFSGPTPDITIDGSGDFAGIVDMVDPPGWMRLAYVRTSGGGNATAFQALYSVREF